MNFSIFSNRPDSIFRDPVPAFPVSDAERKFLNAANYCRDSALTGFFHPNERCYREIPNRLNGECGGGKQFCFGADGMKESHDKASPVAGKDVNGFCQLSARCSFQHFLKDF